MLTRRAGRAGLIVAAAGVIAAIALVPPRARAQSPNDKAAAEALFDEGKKLLDAKNYAEACRAFESSQKLDAGVGTLLYLGDCYERMDRFASAWATFREAAGMAKTAADDKREKIARDRVNGLESKLFRVTVAVTERVPGLVIKRDGQALGEGTWGVPLPVDPGPHTIEASAPGYLSVTKTFEAQKTAGKETVVLPKLEVDNSVPPPASASAPPPSASTPPVPTGSTAPVPPPPEERGNGLLIGGLVVGGIGVIGLAVTGALVGVASSKYSEGDDFCEGTVCTDQRGVELADEARTLGDAATGTLVAGAILAATGATLIVIHFATEPTPSSTVQVGVQGRGDGARLGVWGTF